MAGYSGTPLAKKLGMKPHQRIALVNAPTGLPVLLGDLPAGARLLKRPRKPVDLTLWFVTGRRVLERGMQNQARRLGRDGIWIMWPKQASAMAAEVSQSDVRRSGLGAALVDFKIVAIDETWSGLKFTRRRG